MQINETSSKRVNLGMTVKTHYDILNSSLTQFKGIAQKVDRTSSKRAN